MAEPRRHKYLLDCVTLGVLSQYPNGRRNGEPCDIYWHGVHFGETTQLYAGKVNKFPGNCFDIV